MAISKDDIFGSVCSKHESPKHSLQSKLAGTKPKTPNKKRISGQSQRKKKTGHKYGGDKPQGCHGKAILATPNQQSLTTAAQRFNLTPSRHASLDQATYKWKTWVKFPQERDNDQHDLTLYKITQDTFKKLSDQVRDVNQRTNKYHSAGIKNFCPDGDRTGRKVHPTHLAASLPHQAPSIRSALAGDASAVQQELALQCKPAQRSDRRRPNSSVAVRPKQQQQSAQRPQSTSALNGRPAEFDQLTPRMIIALSDRKQTNFGNTYPGPFDIVSNEAKPEISDDENNHSGEESEDKVYRVRTPPNFDLPAEDLHIDNHRGLFQYRSSSVGKKKQDPYPEALSKPYCYLDLLELSLLKEDWRHTVRAVPNKIEEKLIDRLIEMERLQTASEEWERSQRSVPPKRAASATQLRKGWNSTAALPTERAYSALARPRRSRNCSPDCLQPLCTGDCEMKREPPNTGCIRCKQDYCQGSCTEFGYHLHVRQPRQDEEPPPSRPKSCKSCTASRGSSRKFTVSANTNVLGHPRSAFATFSSARQMTRKPRSISAVATKVSDDMANLDLSSTTGAGGDRPPRPKTATTSSISRDKGHGRNSMLPGKSFASQRRNSLTNELISTSAANMNPKPMRVKSARVKSARVKTKQKRNTNKR